MFIRTDAGRLQNLYLLWDIVVLTNTTSDLDNEGNPIIKYSIGWVQTNGEVKSEGEFTTLEDANTKKESIITMLLAK
jgi:hypothetical protein